MSEPRDQPDNGIDQLWERSRQTIERRVDTIEQWARARLTDEAAETLLQDARQDAHQLAGSLAILGFGAASDAARALDLALRDEPAPSDPGGILEMVAHLRQTLREPRTRPTVEPDTPTGQPSSATLVGEQPGQQPASPTARILLADDDDVIARVIQTALELDGHTVVRARDGGVALHVARELSFDLILLDVQMPIVGGFEACQALRAEPATATIPILLLTAQSDRDHVQRGFASGATDYLTKPFAVAQLRSRVQLWLKRTAEAAR
jgi:CheY-like chemotaxis protein